MTQPMIIQGEYKFPKIDVSPIEVFRDDKGEPQIKGLLPIELFVGTYLSHWLKSRKGEKSPSPFFHRQMYYLYENSEKYGSLIWVCPRYFGKSVLNFFSVIYDAVHTKKFGEQLWLGASGPLVDRWMNYIKTELTSNELIIRDYGVLCSEGDKDGKWTNEELKLRNGERIYGKGYGAAIRGLHPPKIIMDDIENDEQAESAVQIEKMEDWIRGTVINMQEEDDSVLLWTGTFLTRNSVLQKAYEGMGWDDSWFRIKHEAEWLKESDDLHNKISTNHPYKVGDPIWPVRWSTEKLRRRERKIGSSKYLAEYMNDPRSKDLAVFSKEHIRYYEEDDLPKQMRSIVLIDPAVGTKEINCESAIVVLGVDASRYPTPDIFVLDEESGHWEEAVLVRKAINYYLKWRSDYVGIEEVSFSKLLINSVEMESARQGIHLPVEAKKPRSKDKVTRAKSVRPLFERGHVRFLHTQNELIDQLITFPRKGALKDKVDAMVYGLIDLAKHWEDVDEANKGHSKGNRRYDDEPEPEEYAFPELAC